MKGEIIETSLKQFLKYGIREVSIQKLIEPLAISTKTVYKYFENKEQLLEEALLLYYDQQYELLQDLSSKNNTIQLFLDIWYVAVEREYKVSSIFFEDLQYYYPQVKAKVEVAIAEKFTNQFIQIVQGGIQEGLFREDVEPAVAVQGVYVLLTGITRENQFKEVRVPLLTILTNTIVLLIRGMCTKKGIEKLDLHILTFKRFEDSHNKKRPVKAGRHF
jgi:AcrR family transcriptional regulator